MNRSILFAALTLAGCAEVKRIVPINKTEEPPLQVCFVDAVSPRTATRADGSQWVITEIRRCSANLRELGITKQGTHLGCWAHPTGPMVCEEDDVTPWNKRQVPEISSEEQS